MDGGQCGAPLAFCILRDAVRHAASERNPPLIPARRTAARCEDKATGCGSSPLLRNQEFAGIVIRKLWNDSDVLYNVDDFARAMDELVRLIDLE